MHEALERVQLLFGSEDFRQGAVADQTLVFESPSTCLLPSEYDRATFNLKANSWVPVDEFDLPACRRCVQEDRVKGRIVPVGQRNNIGLISDGKSNANDALARQNGAQLRLACDLSFESSHGASIRRTLSYALLRGERSSF